MKKIISYIMAMAVVFCMTVLPFPALAEPATPVEVGSLHCIDLHDQLLDADEKRIEEQAAELSDKYDIGIYVLFTDDLDGLSAREYCESFYTAHGLGVGEGADGIMMMVAINSRDWAIVGHGAGASPNEDPRGRLSDSQREAIGEEIVDPLHDRNWYKASALFLEDIDDALGYYAEHGKAKEYVDWFQVFLVFGAAILIAAMFAYMFVRKDINAMRTARKRSEASDYLCQESFQLTQQSDTFVNSHTAVVHHASKDSSSSSWSDGGFSGSSGKF